MVDLFMIRPMKWKPMNEAFTGEVMNGKTKNLTIRTYFQASLDGILLCLVVQIPIDFKIWQINLAVISRPTEEFTNLHQKINKRLNRRCAKPFLSRLLSH